MQPICETVFAKDHATATNPPPSPNLPTCPACAGRLLFLSNFYRCCRCGFCLCVGCEEGPGTGLSDSNSV